MKKIIVLFSLLIAVPAVSQIVPRIEVLGTIIVEGSDLSGITIFNSSSNKGVVTNEKGEFKLEVALNDNIDVSAIQYANINFKVNKAIIQSKIMKLFLIDEINKLDEIILLNNDLSGNLEADLNKTTPFKPKLDALYFGIKHSGSYNFENDYNTEVENTTIDRPHLPLVNGLNVVNIVDQLLLPLFRQEAKEKKKVDIPLVPVNTVKYYFGSEFLVDNFNIPKHRVEEFIRFVEDDNFDYSLLNYGKELEFLELLNTMSIKFLKQE